MESDKKVKFNIQLFADDTEVSLKFTNKVSGEKKLEKYSQELAKIYALLQGMDKSKILSIQGASDATTNALKEQSKYINNQNEDIKDIKKNVSLAFNYTTLRTFTRALKGLTKTMSSYVAKSASYLENMNLLDVAYNSNTKSAEKFVNTLSEMYGLDESWGYRTVGIFKQLSNAMGLTAEMGDKLSTTMTQFAVDVSSLYNMDTDSAVSILQSALAGQTKPARRLGADITQTTLQTTLDQSGIDRNITGLSYVEKRLVIVASLLQQVSEANGDWGRTIESVANQTRIMSEQWDRLTRALGNVFLPIVQKILPYVNAILMVITEILNVIARLVGYNEKDFDYFATASDDVIDFQEGLAGSNKELKKLKSGLRAFDELNNITTPSDSNVSAGGGLGIDPNIADMFNKTLDDYNSKLEKVQMKATKIRDSIMAWLGFTKIVDKETGKVSFKFEKITGGTMLGALITSGAIYKGISAIYGIFSKLLPMINTSGEGSSIFAILTEGISAFPLETLVAITGAITLFSIALVDLYTKNEEFANGVNEIWNNVSDLFTTIISDITSTLVKFWNTYAKPIYDALVRAWDNFEKMVLILWEQFLKPVIDKITETINDLWKTTLKPMFDKVMTIIGELGILIMGLWNNFIAPVVKLLLYTLAPTFETVFSFIIDIAGTLFKTIGGVINGILDVFKGVIKFLAGTFTGDWNKALNGIVDILKGIVNIAISVVEGLMNGIITIINLGIKGIFNGIKSLVNLVLSTVENIAEILGFDVDLTIKGVAPQIGKVSLPRLKTGMDFVPKDFYGPVYLDYGERVLTKEENQRYSNNDDANSSIGNTSFNPTFIVQVGSKELAREVLTELQDMAISNGRPIVIGG